jgi:hypothetical protein
MNTETLKYTDCTASNVHVAIEAEIEITLLPSASYLSVLSSNLRVRLAGSLRNSLTTDGRFTTSITTVRAWGRWLTTTLRYAMRSA